MMPARPFRRFGLLSLLWGLLIATAGSPGQENQTVFRAGVQLIEVYATVYDHHGRYVDGLGRDSFAVMENGQPQPVVNFEDPSDGVACALVLDTTGSMTKALPFLQNSSSHFIDQLGPKDEIAIYTFTDRLELRQDFTLDRAAAKRAVLRTRAGGTTALFDALAQTAREISGHKGKKAIVVFTDGDDNASALNLSSAANRLRKLGIPLFAIAEGEALDAKPLMKVLDDVSRQTGGIAHEVKKISDVEKIFIAVSEQLQHTYMLTYKATPSQDKSWRAITVAVKAESDLKVRAREGYFPD
jgi:VWFA-related protein